MFYALVRFFNRVNDFLEITQTGIQRRPLTDELSDHSISGRRQLLKRLFIRDVIRVVICRSLEALPIAFTVIDFDTHLLRCAAAQSRVNLL